MNKTIIILLLAFSFTSIHGQEKLDMPFLKGLTQSVIDSSYVFNGDNLPKSVSYFGPNNTGVDLIRPGGRTNYPAFWIRDYAMSVETDLISLDNQREIILFTASHQADKALITGSGSLIPLGSIPDHISFRDNKPIYFPGTIEDFQNQGNEIWRIPPYCDQFFFIHMAYNYWKKSADSKVLVETINNRTLIDRLQLAFNVVPTTLESPLVHINENFNTSDFGFRDIVTMTGDLSFSSVLKYRAANQLSEMFAELGDSSLSAKYKEIADDISELLPKTFSDDKGFLRASTGLSKQSDVWATAFAIYTGALDSDNAKKASITLVRAYKEGTLSNAGYIRHILTTDDFSDETAWEKARAAKNTYQNGSYWSTPVGWVVYSIALTDKKLARKMASEYIDQLKKTDFRKGIEFGGPFECIFPENDYYQNPVYMTSVTSPYAVFMKMGY